jgi:hypothetical protein
MNQTVYLRDLDSRGAPTLRFRLTYRGPLQANRRDSLEGQRVPLADHKQVIRKQFHRQLRNLWTNNKFLSETRITPSSFTKLNQPITDQSWNLGSIDEPETRLIDEIASQYQYNGYQFVPLVREDMSVSCVLDVLFLRRDNPGSVLYAGDLDNRMKTLIDALRIPKMAQELGTYSAPDNDETPFFVLLADDKLVSGFTVESDTLLDYVSDGESVSRDVDLREVNLIISVSITPYSVTLFNLNFA